MNIAVVHNLPAGGQKRELFEQLRYLSKNHTIDLFTPATANESYLPLAPFLSNHMVIPYQYPSHFPQSVYSIYFKLPGVYKKIAEFINNGGYDVTLVHPDFLTQAPYVLRFLTIPSLYHCAEPKREFYEHQNRRSNFFSYYATFLFRLPIKWIDQKNAKSATKILANSAYSKRRINGIYHVNSDINHLGVDLQQFYKKPRLKEDAVLSVGEFSPHKGYEFVIRSLARIPARLRPTYMIVGHGGREKKYVYNFARKHHVRIALYENVSEKELVAFYNRAKVFVYAAYNEPFGLVLLEAAACGVPIVAVKEGGIGEVLSSGAFGIGVERSEVAFAAALQHVLSGEYHLRYTENRKILQEKWSWITSAAQLETELLKLCGK